MNGLLQRTINIKRNIQLRLHNLKIHNNFNFSYQEILLKEKHLIRQLNHVDSMIHVMCKSIDHGLLSTYIDISLLDITTFDYISNKINYFNCDKELQIELDSIKKHPDWAHFNNKVRLNE
jgi:hypothetical protein